MIQKENGIEVYDWLKQSLGHLSQSQRLKLMMIYHDSGIHVYRDESSRIRGTIVVSRRQIMGFTASGAKAAERLIRFGLERAGADPFGYVRPDCVRLFQRIGKKIGQPFKDCGALTWMGLDVHLLKLAK